MTEEKETTSKDEPLPFCTTAPSAEHDRGANEDKSCDDSRGAE